MQWVAGILLSTYFFLLLVNGAFWWFGTELENAGLINPFNNPIKDKGDGFIEQGTQFNDTINSFEGGGGFNPIFLFGDFGKGVTAFFQAVSGGYVMDTLGRLGMSEVFQTYMQIVVLGFLGVGTLIYYISGRS
jgi:hypothetical protein